MKSLVFIIKWCELTLSYTGTPGGREGGQGGGYFCTLKTTDYNQPPLAGELDKSGLCGNVSSVLGKKKKKKRRHRTIFTSYQLEELEKAFKVEVELSPDTPTELAS